MLSRSMNRICRWLSAGTVACLLSACSNGFADTVAVKGDPVHGKELYEECAGCHELQTNKVGPMHCGLFGRPAGTVPGFVYSEAMRTSGIVWDAQKLDEFLTSPIDYVNGTLMGFVGFFDPTDRADVIAYLYQVNNDPAVCPR
jgi:cytochrome c